MRFGIPCSQQPSKVLANIIRQGIFVPGRVYYFDNGFYIRGDIGGHTFSDGAAFGRHFNAPNGRHYFY